ncbi:MAG: tetratricopeptide repeat protein, partial [Acinetobacter sp.]
MKTKLSLCLVLALIMTGCSTLTPAPEESKKSVEKPHHKAAPKTENGVTITPYDVGEIKREQLPPPAKHQTQLPTVIVPKNKPSAQPQPQPQVPAYRNLIGQAQLALNQRQYARADHLATQAQRISPQHAQSYVILAQSAMQQKQYTKALSLAQRGLSLTSDPNLKKQLWQIRLQVAKAQNSPTAIQQAQ